MTGAALSTYASAALQTFSRRRRAAAVAIDAATLVGALVITSLPVLIWLLARTEAGRLEVPESDARLAAALLLAVPPAWFAWLAPSVTRGTTLGQRCTGLEVRGTAVARFNRLALHPLALPLWSWLALVAFAAGTPRLGVALAFVAALVLALGLGSFLLWAASPESRALHDRLARTRLVRAAQPEARS